MTNEDIQDQWLTDVMDQDIVSPTRTLVQGIVEKLRFDPEVMDDSTWLSSTADSLRDFAAANPTGY